MTPRHRWDRCVYHRGSHTQEFLWEYLADDHRKVLLVVGAGFDPRSTRIAALLPERCRKRASAVLLREERPDPAPSLVERANASRDQLQRLIPQAQEHQIQVLAEDNAVVGGRNAAALVSRIAVEDATDVFVDVSALSMGVAFPIIRCLLNILHLGSAPKRNLHVMCCDSPDTDMAIGSIPSDMAAPIHGFKGGWGLDEKSKAAMLWMPQLGRRKHTVLRRIFELLQNVQPDTVVCPILPFPACHPRFPDELIEEYAEELQSAWSVDARDLVYADEKNPLDLYRTILRIDDARRHVFRSIGGSQIVLSPLGSKALSLGALMAALERDFTVLYVESVAYTLSELPSPGLDHSEDLVHIWLHGDAYSTKERIAK